jgi:predicted ferric reductase
MNVEWMLIRGSGMVAFALLAAATVWGLLVSTKVLGVLAKPKAITWFHESLAIGALLATGIHIAVLSMHDFVEFSWAEILVPGVSDWRKGAVALGVVSLYGLVIVTGSFYVKKHIGQRAWRSIHFGSLGVFLAALLHGIASGTDTRTPLAVGLYLGSAVVVGCLVCLRLSSLGTARSPRASDQSESELEPAR